MLFFYIDNIPYYICNSNIIGFELGGYYRFNFKRIVRFIQSTSTGFNFVDLNKGTVIFNKPLYAIKDKHKAARHIPLLKDYDGRNIIHFDNFHRKITPPTFIPMNYPKNHK